MISFNLPEMMAKTVAHDKHKSEKMRKGKLNKQGIKSED